MLAVDADVNGDDVVAGLESDVGDLRNFASADGGRGDDDDATNRFIDFLYLIQEKNILRKTNK